MIISKLSSTLKTEVYMKNIFAVNLIPKLRILPQPCRRLNGYIYVIEGEMDFCFKNNRIHIYPGCIIYLPHGSNHIYRAVSEKIRYIRLDFEMYSAEKNEMIVFSSTPQLITNNADHKVVNILSEMSAIFYTGGYASVLKIKALLYEFLYEIEKSMHCEIFIKQKNVAALCIEHIQKHYSKSITITDLCKISKQSPSHIRRRFKAVTGYTIAEYVNKCRVDRSMYLLASTDMSIIDIALDVGYTDQNYYSRVFKKFVNKSPSEYRKEYRI